MLYYAQVSELLWVWVHNEAATGGSGNSFCVPAAAPRWQRRAFPAPCPGPCSSPSCVWGCVWQHAAHCRRPVLRPPGIPGKLCSFNCSSQFRQSVCGACPAQWLKFCFLLMKGSSQCWPMEVLFPKFNTCDHFVCLPRFPPWPRTVAGMDTLRAQPSMEDPITTTQRFSPMGPQWCQGTAIQLLLKHLHRASSSFRGLRWISLAYLGDSYSSYILRHAVCTQDVQLFPEVWS